MRRLLLVLSAALVSCVTPSVEPAPLASIEVRVIDAPALTPVLAESFDYVPWGAVTVGDGAVEPADDALQVEVSLGAGLGCSECYAVTGSERAYAVTASDPLGAQYAVTALLEAHGFRFFHPERPLAPAALVELDAGAAADAGLDGSTVAPEIPVRGLHPHTLHPIEGFYDFWDATRGREENAKRVVDWVIRQRGNLIQYPGVNDVYEGGAALAFWRAHTTELLDYAHSRGVRMSLGIQLFAGSNLQQALDLLPSFSTPELNRQRMEERLGILLDETPFDRLSLSFGEFFEADPEQFIEAVNLAYEVATELRPGIEMTSVIHVGEDVVVEYEGQEFIYYFLVQFARQEILHHVHTVMYYNLFEPTSGAYGHEEFPEHRAFLFDSLAADEPTGYFPETAYWVAFDIPVPTWIPFYAQSRWTDLDRIAARTTEEGIRPLDEHVLFSSGWEWGYWQQDVLSLRWSHTRPDDWRDGWRWLFSVWGGAGALLAEQVIAVSETEHTYLIEGELGAYLGGRDSTLDSGEQIGILAQPPRVRIQDVPGLNEEELLALSTAVVFPMDQFAIALDQHHAALEALDGLDTLPTGEPNRFYAEIVDGADVTAARARFMAAIYAALVAEGLGDNDAVPGLLAQAEQAMARGRAAVDRRHADLHDPDPALLTEPNENGTIYQFGYLTRAETLCHWERDLAQARNVLLGAGDPVPGCAL